MRSSLPGPSVGCAGPIRGAAAQPTGGIRRSCGGATRTTRATDSGCRGSAGLPVARDRYSSGHGSGPAANHSCPPVRACAQVRTVSGKDRVGNAPDAILEPRVGQAGMDNTPQGNNMNKSPSKRVAYRTNYPRLYEQAYWGTHPADDEIGSPEIIANRNRLAEEYGLEKYFRVLKPWIASGLPFGYDHPEGYRMADGRVLLLISYYGCSAPPYLQMQPVGSLYHVRAQSFIRVFDGLRQLKKAVETLDQYEGNPPDEAAELRSVEAMLANPESEGVRRVLAECRHCGRSFWFLTRPHVGSREWRPDNAKMVEFVLREYLGYGKAAAIMIRKAIPDLSARVEDPAWRAVVARREQAKKRKRGGGA